MIHEAVSNLATGTKLEAIGCRVVGTMGEAMSEATRKGLSGAMGKAMGEATSDCLICIRLLRMCRPSYLIAL